MLMNAQEHSSNPVLAATPKDTKNTFATKLFGGLLPNFWQRFFKVYYE
jgi:hypothetical protein